MDSPMPATDLEKELTCSICTDLLYQPLTLLDCLHTFCGACLKEWFGWQALAAETSPNPPAPGAPIFTCPSCRDAVRSTKHNATVVTLLDMLLTAQPDKRKPDDEKAEMDAKYRPGDNVFPHVRLPKRSPEQQRLDEAERRLIDEVREISRQEAVAAAEGGTGTSSPGSSARAARQRRRAARTGGAAGSGTDSASEEDGRRHHQHHHSADPSLPRIMGHQSSLRSLISGSQGGPAAGSAAALDIEREIEAFARQIQEEGLLDGLDLDNIDLTNDDELSRRIAEAYQRRQRGRARHESGARHDGSAARRDASRQDGSRQDNTASSRNRASSAVSHHSQASTAGTVQPERAPERSSGRATLAVSSAAAGGRPPSSSSRTSSRHRSQSQSSHHRSRSSTSGARPQSAVLADGVTPVPLAVSRPPISNASSSHHSSHQHLEVRDDSRDQHHQRRRTASEGRSATMPTSQQLGGEPSAGRPSARSQTDLPLRYAAELQGDTVIRPAELSSQSPSSSSSSLQSNSNNNNNNSPTAASFHARAMAMGLQGPSAAQQQQQRPHSSSAAAASPTSVNESQARAKRAAATSTGGGAVSTTQASPATQRPAAIATANRTTPPPMTAASFALSPVTIDTYELPALSAPSASSQQHQQQQQGHQRARSSTLFREPDIACARCGRQHIEYDLHYNCAVCSQGHWNICLDCYRAGKGCQHWFGFGYAAWHKWEKKAKAEGPGFPKPHMLTANRYLPPRIVPGGAEGRRTLTTEDPQDRLQSGVFCANTRCRHAWANSCYWRCDVCNEGDWGFCDDCVNQGLACTHPLLPLTHQPAEAQQQQQQQQQKPVLPAPPPRPPTAALLQLPGETSAGGDVAAPRIGAFRALTFTTTCDLCRVAIPPSRARFHCYACASTAVAPEDSSAHPGTYNVCQECYGVLAVDGEKAAALVAPENGPRGWRRCPAGGHRMVVVAFREDGKSGLPRRVVLEDLVGGFRLEAEKAAVANSIDVETWYVWYAEQRLFERAVSRDVRARAAAATDAPFPPPGGVGHAAVARWAYYPEASSGDGNGDGGAAAADADNDDELSFPRLAEIREIEDVNGEWFHGVYMGRKGLFPSGFVKMIGG